MATKYYHQENNPVVEIAPDWRMLLFIVNAVWNQNLQRGVEHNNEQ